MRLGLQGKAILLLLAIALVPLSVALVLVGEITEAATRVGAGEVERLRTPLEHLGEAYREAVSARKEVYRVRSEQLAGTPEAAAACTAAAPQAAAEALLGKDERLMRVAIVAGERELAAAERRFAQPMRALDVSPPANADGCHLALRWGFPAQLLEDQQTVAEALREQRFLGKLRGTLPHSYWIAFAVLFGGVVAAVTLIGILVARATSRRLAALAAATQRVAGGDLEARVDVPGRDEVADLGHAFNSMVEDLRRSRAEIEYLEKIGAWQEVARRLAHEIKNPLTPIQLAVQQLRSKYDGSDARFRRMLDDAAEIVTEEVAGLRRLVDAFSSFAKLPRVEPQNLDLGGVIEEIARDAAGLSVELAPPPSPLSVAADRHLLKRALVNLVDNAREAGGKTVRIGWSGQGGVAVVTVDDDGSGVPDAVAARVFDPYVTTKEHGTGLGLAIVKKTLLEHGGDVTLARERAPLGGARFELRLPLPAPPGAEATASAPPPRPARDA